MADKILLTSFDTWLPYQKSNSSDDLLNEISINYTDPQLNRSNFSDSLDKQKSRVKSLNSSWHKGLG